MSLKILSEMYKAKFFLLLPAQQLPGKSLPIITGNIMVKPVKH